MAMNLTTRMVKALKLGETASSGFVGITWIATTQGAIHTIRASLKEASRLPLASTTKSWSAAMMMIDMPSDFSFKLAFKVFWMTIDLGFDRRAPS